MARSRSYWPVVRFLRDRYDLTLGEARAGWRVLRDLFEGDKPTVAELKRHPVISERVARDLVVKRADVFVEPPVAPEKPKGLPGGGDVGQATEEWHVSISYKDKKGRFADLAISVIGPAGAVAKQIKGVVWRALLGHSLDRFKVAGVEWGKQGSKVQEYQAADLPSFKAFAHAATWRIALLGE